MMTEVIQQKVRPRRSVGVERTSRGGFVAPLGAAIRDLGSAVDSSIRGRVAPALRRRRLKRLYSRVEASRRRPPPFSLSLAGSGGAAEAVADDPILGGIRAFSRYLFFLGTAFAAVFLVYSAVAGGAFLPLSGTDDFFLPQQGEIEDLLRSYVEPPSPEVLAGDMKSPDPLRFAALSLSSRSIGRGDTISGIARSAGLNLDTIVSLNKIEDVRRVPVGAALKIPNQNGILYTVRRGDSLSGISRTFNVGMNALADVNNLESATIHPGQELFIPGARMKPLELKKVLGELFIFPTLGRITSGFGPRNDPFTGVRRFHNGIDIAGPMGAPVNAAMAGKVVKIDFHPTYGRYVILSHPSGYQTWYAHLNKAETTQGATVAQGEMIGRMGNTGYSTGTHLHFSVFKNGSPVDPMTFLR